MRRVAIVVGVAVVVGLALYWRYRPAAEALWWLASGWATYPSRVLPEVRVAWDGVAMGLVGLGLFAAGLHRTLRWLYREIRRPTDAPVEGREGWSARWTASLVALIVLMFVAGISATAVVHQTGWLVASRRSLVEERQYYLYEDATGRNTPAARLQRIGRGLVSLGKIQARFPRPEEDRPGGEARQSWMVDLLQGMNYYGGGKSRPDLPWDAPENSAAFKGIVPEFLNPEIGVIRSPEGYGLAHYAGNVRVLGPDRAYLRVEAGEASNTILAGEVAEGFRPWGDPANLRDPGLGVNAVPGGFGGPSGSGANFAFADGSVRFFRNTTSRDVLRRLSRPAPPGR